MPEQDPNSSGLLLLVSNTRTTDLRGVMLQASATRESPVRAEPHPT
jgi:hypothetical protein